ncbi:single-stranded DNA-binding protein [Marinilongibacter aquaticus]|nr:single-stranded DNA-binding protein [Marinilongibacter aquaticus]UBM58182.1 single-stranded DNA-binding protein [Marinilongibacter aquaticus]
MNTVTLIGNAGSDAEIRTFENGKKASFSLATKTEWHYGIGYLPFCSNN